MVVEEDNFRGHGRELMPSSLGMSASIDLNQLLKLKGPAIDHLLVGELAFG